MARKLKGRSKGVPNSIMLAKPFAPAQLVTAVATLLKIALRRPSRSATSKNGAGIATPVRVCC
jgi:hypothetical protein